LAAARSAGLRLVGGDRPTELGLIQRVQPALAGKRRAAAVDLPLQLRAREQLGELWVAAGRQQGQAVQQAGDALPSGRLCRAAAGPAADLQSGVIEASREGRATQSLAGGLG